MPEKEEGTLDLWDRHRTPHRDACKEFVRTGGFRGIAVDPMWTIHEATKEWGPMGVAWGFTVVEERVYEHGDDILHTAKIVLWWPGAAKDEEVPAGIHSVGTTFLVKRGKMDEEAPKKSYTDALAKALSWLGFGADVFMGMFDSNKYADVFGEETEDQATEEETTQDPPDDEFRELKWRLFNALKKKHETEEKARSAAASITKNFQAYWDDGELTEERLAEYRKCVELNESDVNE